MLDGQDAAQRDLDKLERLAPVKLKKFSTRQNARLCTWAGTISNRLGGGWLESSPAGKDKRLKHNSVMCTCKPESKPYPGVHKKKND